MSAAVKAQTKPSAKIRCRLRTFTSGGSMAAYEAAKAAWDAAHPGADFQTREQAMRRLARAMGV